MERYEQVEKRSFGRMLVNNFFGGIAWGLGATIGLALVLTLLGYILKRIDFVPIVGSFVSQVTQYSYQKAQPNINKMNQSK